MPTGGLEAGVAVVDDVKVEAKVLVGDGLAGVDVEGPGIAVTCGRDCMSTPRSSPCREEFLIKVT
jgi:hypothetical protein